jgi:hypothetical protein
MCSPPCSAPATASSSPSGAPAPRARATLACKNAGQPRHRYFHTVAHGGQLPGLAAEDIGVGINFPAICPNRAYREVERTCAAAVDAPLISHGVNSASVSGHR